MNQITKRIIIYILGTFLLGIGVTFSIKADLGVSPVSSFGYAIALITSISVGTAVFFIKSRLYCRSIFAVREI